MLKSQPYRVTAVGQAVQYDGSVKGFAQLLDIGVTCHHHNIAALALWQTAKAVVCPAGKYDG